MKKSIRFIAVALLIFSANNDAAVCQRIMENLGRGLIAMSRGNNQIYVGWRLLGSDPGNIAFNLYHSAGGGAYNRINVKPMRLTTDTLLSGCNLSVSNSFYVKPVIGTTEQSPSPAFTVAANAPVRNYLSSITLSTVKGGYFRCFNAMAGDADGDGEYEIFLLRKNFYVNAGQSTGDTSRMLLECYRLNGSFLWRFEFGPNINCSDPHNAEAYYVVADFDGDGKSEVCVRASELSVFRAGSPQRRIVGDYLKPDGITLYPFDPNGSMQRTAMPEYLYILNGMTGAPLDSVKYQPAMTSIPFTFWGPNERPFYQWMSIAYLDGKLPSIITERGIGDGQPLKIYGWDYRNGDLTMRPDSFVTTNVYSSSAKYYVATPKIGFGGHSIRIKDIDNDGRDEILLTASAIDHNLKLIYNQTDKGLGHGDMFEILDIDPDRPGLEFFCLQQSNSMQIGSALWDASSGEILKEYFTTKVTDPSRAGSASLVPYLRGAQVYGGTPGVMDARGRYINKQSFTPCASAYWDADLSKELVFNDYNRMTGNIQKYDPSTGNVNVILDFQAEGCESRTMNGAAMICDLLGDWREEILYETADLKELRIYTTTIPSNTRIYNLMQNPGYRVQTTCLGRAGGFFTDYYIGPQMGPVPPSPLLDAGIRWTGDESAWDVDNTASFFLNKLPVRFNQGNNVIFDEFGLNGTVANKTVTLNGVLEPASVSVWSGTDYVFAGTGSLTGAMSLLKCGTGTLTLDNSNSFTGKTEVWDGALIIDASFSSPVTVRGGTFGGAATKGLGGGRLGGNGTIGADIEVGEAGAIVPGNGMANAGTLNVTGNVSLSKSSYFGFDISENPSSPKDMVFISGNLAIRDTVSFYFNLLNGSPAAGDYPLIQYGGALTGFAGNIYILGLDQVPCTVYESGKTIGLRVFPTRAPADIVWAGTSGTWDLGITRSWTNGASSDVFALDDRVTINDAGNAQPVINLMASLPAGGFTVASSKDYTIKGAGSISGAAGLVKSGSGKLTINTLNNFTGTVSLGGGIIEINSINNKGLPGALGASAQAISIDGGTLRVSSATVYTNRDITLGSSGATFDIADSKFPLVVNGKISGTGKLTKTGSGALLLSGSNTFSGGMTINEGDVSLLGSAGNTSGPGTGTITLNGGALNMGDVRLSETAAWNLVVPEGKTAGLFTDGRCSLTGKLTGSGTLNIMIPYIRTNFSGDWSGFTGTINILYDPHYAPDFRINNSYGYSQAAFYLTQAAAIYRIGSGTTTIGEISGIAGSELATLDELARTSNWIVGTRNTNAEFAGTTTGPGSITKSGTGTWTLSGKIRHTGITYVSGGTLLVTADSIKGSSIVNVNAGGTLAGTPFITGPVNVNPGGTIAPGNSPALTGTMKLLGTLDLKAGSTTVIKINKAAGLQDTLRIKQSVFLGGTLNIQLLAGSWKAGDSFRIIRASSFSGNFSEVIPSAPGPGFAWDMSLMATSGTIGIKGTQTILFNPLPDKKSHDKPFIVSATGGASGNPVIFTSSDPKVAMISGNTVTITGPGAAFITASQEGNDLFLPAEDVTQLLNVIEDGIIDISKKFKVYPNPVSGHLYINAEGGEGDFELYSSLGTKIRSGRILEALELDLDNLPPGLYSLKVARENVFKVWRIVKQ